MPFISENKEMKLVIQRVTNASVIIKDQLFSSIQKGLLVLVGIEKNDNENDIEYLVNKLTKLRIFDDKMGKMNLSLTDIKGEILIVSQFTLLANTRKGNRPSYIDAGKPDFSKPMYEKFCSEVEKKVTTKVQKGQFGANMKISLTNDGPVTIWIDSADKKTNKK